MIDMQAIFDDESKSLGHKIGKLYTDHGLPPDMSLERVVGSRLEKIAIVHGVCTWLIEHKRNSGATDNAVQRQRNKNREVLERFCRTGEMGLF